MKRSEDCLDPLPYYKWHWLRYRASRKVQRMSILERGIYRELLDEQWAQGYIAGDDKSLSEILEDSKQVLASAKQVLSKCFTEISHNVWQNETLEEQRTENDAIRAKRKLAGLLGGLAKKDSEASAKQVLASATDAEADASKCHIEEKIREDKRREERVVNLPPEPQPHSDEVLFRVAKGYPKLSTINSEYDIPRADADLIIEAICEVGDEKLTGAIAAYVKSLDNIKFAMKACDFFGKPFAYRQYIQKPKPKILSPAERTRISLAESEREQEEKRAQTTQGAN